MKLDKGTFGRVLVGPGWHSILVAHGWVKQSDAKADSVEMIVEIIDSDDAGIWVIDHDPGGQFMEDVRFWIPWRFVVSVATHPDMRASVRSVGFQAARNG
jgi:hypothetical protein